MTRCDETGLLHRIGVCPICKPPAADGPGVMPRKYAKMPPPTGDHYSDKKTKGSRFAEDILAKYATIPLPPKLHRGG